MYLDVKINNVPVQLEVKNVGPASLEDIDEFREKLRSGDLVLVDQAQLPEENPYFKPDEPQPEPVVVQPAKETPIAVPEPSGDKPEPLMEEEPSLVDVIVDNAPEIIEEVQEAIEKGKKVWWKSKTIWSNGLAAIGCILATFVADNPEASAFLPASVLAVANLWLRVVSSGKIKLPMEDQIKKFRKVEKKPESGLDK